MPESEILQGYVNDYKREWLDIYEKAEELKEFKSSSQAQNAIRRAAVGVLELIDSINSNNDAYKTGAGLSYTLESVIDAIDTVIEEGSTEDKKALIEVLEIASKTTSYVITQESENKKFWSAIDRDTTLENFKTVLKAERTVN